MTADEFETRADAALGRGWRGIFARAVERDASTVRRWIADGAEPPPYAVALLELIEVTPAAFRPDRWLEA
jgi:hypothetical protein